jgi:ribonuclease VapC
VSARLDTVAVDTSALVAAFLEEDEAADYGLYLHRFQCLIGWPTLVEFCLVMARKIGRDDLRDLLDHLEGEGNVHFVDFRAAHYRAATNAFLLYGKGRHPAGLNYGDCLAYAIAKEAGVPLLFKGEDFAKTDILPAIGTR